MRGSDLRGKELALGTVGTTRKRLARLTSAVVLFLYSLTPAAVVLTAPQKAMAVGSGSSSSPYQIGSCSQLSSMNANLDAVYELSSDIDCSGMDPGRIGSQQTPFTGEFRGNGHTIANITVVTTDSGMGVFGYTSNATIYNVVLDNIYIGGANNVGALVGFANYTNIWYVSVVNSNVTGTGQHTGGIVGYLGGSTVSRSYVDESEVSGDANVGGIAGTAIGPSSISDSYAMPGATAGVTGILNVGGIAGQSGAGPTIIANTYADRTLVGQDQSSYSPVDSYEVSGPFSPPWDFDSIWNNTNPFPTLRTFPQMLCEAPSSTQTTIRAACQTEPALTGTPFWEIQYKFADSSSWTSLPNQSGVGFDATVSSMLPGTSYKVRFRFNSDGLVSAWGSQEILTTGSGDVDGDGVSNQVESLGPNGGDANNDGTPDYQQANVTSFKSFVSGGYIVLKTSCGDNFNIQLGLESAESKDAAYDYPTGLVAFVGRECGVGATVDVQISFFGSYDSLVLRKRTSTGYMSVPGVSIQRTTVASEAVTIAQYQVKDGGLLDDDRLTDGNIVDPVGLALSTVGAPNTGIGRQNR